jgi:hypothetical protein
VSPNPCSSSVRFDLSVKVIFVLSVFLSVSFLVTIVVKGFLPNLRLPDRFNHNIVSIKRSSQASFNSFLIIVWIAHW